MVVVGQPSSILSHGRVVDGENLREPYCLLVPEQRLVYVPHGLPQDAEIMVRTSQRVS